MATSNSTNFNMDTQSIIKRALQLIDVVGSGESVSGDDYSLAEDVLNMMVKAWQADGLHLWTETEGIVFVEADQASYVLDGADTDQATSEDIKTELSVALEASDTAVSVDSTANMAVSDIIGIVLDDGTIHWDTIATIPTSTTLTLTTGVSGAAAVDNHVYAYTSTMVRPLDISSVRVEGESGTITNLLKLSRHEYFRLNNKAASGRPHSFYFDRQRDSGTLYIYPVPDSGEYRLRATFHRELQDFDASTDTPDLPQSWLQALVQNLAVELAPYFGKEDKAAKIEARAVRHLNNIRAWDSEHASLKIR